MFLFFFFFSSRRRHTRFSRDWSSDVCSSDLGAAMVGLRPIIEFMTWNFSAVAFDQILSNASKIRQMSGGQFTVPIVFRAPNASAAQVGAQHSHAMEHFYAHIPGLKIIAPAMPADAKGLLKTAWRER